MKRTVRVALGVLLGWAAAVHAVSPTGGMQRIAKLKLADPGTRSLYNMVYDPAGFAYVSTSGAVSPGRVVKVDVRGAAPVEVGTGTCGAGEGGLIAGAIDPAAGYAYFGALGTPGRVVKFALGAPGSAPTYLGSTPLAAGENGVFGMLIDTTDPDPANHYLYVATQTSPGFVVKLSPGAGSALPVRLGAAALLSGENAPRRGVLDAAHGYAYFATLGDPSTIVKIALGSGGAAPTRTGAVTLLPGEGMVGSAVIDAPNGYAYFGTYEPSVVPAKVVKVALGAGSAAPTRVGALTLGPGERELSTGVGDPGTGYAFFGSDHTHPAKIYKIRMGEGAALPTEVGVLQLATGTCGTACYPADGGNISSADADLYGELYLQSSAIDLGTGFAYFGTDTVPGQVVKVKLHDVPPAGKLYTLAPCRLVDTRNAAGPLGGPSLGAGSDRTFALAGTCGVPPTARSLVTNVTVTGGGADGDLRAWPADGLVPPTSAINFRASQTRANNAVLLLSNDGTGSVTLHSDAAAAVDVLLDVSGWFE